LDALWRRTAPRQADVVIATLRGDPSRHGFADLAAALACAARAVRPEGKIILLSEASPAPDACSGLLRRCANPEDVGREYLRRADLDLAAAWQWAVAASRASLHILSEMDDVERLFARPLDNF